MITYEGSIFYTKFSFFVKALCLQSRSCQIILMLMRTEIEMMEKYFVL